MATQVISFKVEIDEKGAVKGVESINSALQKSGRSGNVVFTQLSKQQKQANEAAQLFSRTLGVELPRSIEHLIGKSTVLGPMFSAAFNVAVVGAFTMAIVQLIPEIKNAALEVGGYTAAVREYEAATIAASQTALVTPQTISIGQRNLTLLNQQITAQRVYADALRGSLGGQNLTDPAGMSMFIASLVQARSIESDLAKNESMRVDLIKQMGDLQEQNNQILLQAAGEAGAAGLKGSAAIEQARQAKDLEMEKVKDVQSRNTLITLNDLAASRQQADLWRQGQDQVRQEKLQTVAAWATGDAAIVANTAVANEAIRKQYRDTAITLAQANAIITANNQQAQAQMEKADRDRIHADVEGEHSFHDQMQQMVAQNTGAQLQGIAAVNAGRQKDLGALDRQLQDSIDKYGLTESIKTKLTEDAAAARKAIEAKALAETAELHRTFGLETAKLESDAAILLLPPWQRGYAQIAADHQRLMDELHRQKDQGEIDDKEFASRRVAIDHDANARMIEEHRQMVEQFGSEIESLWDDIASGSLWKRILNNAKKMMSQILAAWLMQLSGAKSGIGSFLGALLFGPGSSGAGVLGGGGGGFNLGTLFGGGMGTTPTTFPGGTISGLPTGTGPFGFFSGLGGGGSSSGAGGSGQSAQRGGGASGPGGLIGTILNAMGGGGSGGGANGGFFGGQGVGGGLGGSYSGYGTQSPASQLAGLGLTMTGQKFGGTLGGIGTMIGLSGPGMAMQAGMPALAGALSALGAGLAGFGIGYQNGKWTGTLGGAAQGAAMGFLFGGPMGAAVGAIVGAIAGFIGGIFGGAKRRRQAENLASQQLSQVNKILQEYKTFQLDYGSALNNMDQLDQQTQQAMKQLKGEGSDVYKKKFKPQFDTARAEIVKDETERNRRTGLVFGPPQFHSGGYVFGRTALRPGEVMAKLEAGEFITNKEATKKNLGALRAINSGASMDGGGGGDTYHFTVNAIDSKSFEQALTSGSLIQVIRKRLNRDSMEYAGNFQ